MSNPFNSENFCFVIVRPRPLNAPLLAIDNDVGLNYFDDLEFLKLYVSELERLSSKKYLDSLKNSKASLGLSSFRSISPIVS